MELACCAMGTKTTTQTGSTNIYKSFRPVVSKDHCKDSSPQKNEFGNNAFTQHVALACSQFEGL